jgi:hypothetical protein
MKLFDLTRHYPLSQLEWNGDAARQAIALGFPGSAIANIPPKSKMLLSDRSKTNAESDWLNRELSDWLGVLIEQE